MNESDTRGVTIKPRALQKTLIVILLVLTGLSTAGGREYALRRQVDGWTFSIAINQNPPIVGKNEIRIEIKDPQGSLVSNLPVTVNYYMAPMPGMPPMNYTLKASPHGSMYSATMNFIMTGPWNIVLKAPVSGKLLRMTVPIDVR